MSELVEIEIQLRDKFEAVPVGSRVTCNPPIINTDKDFLVLDVMGSVYLEKWLLERGFRTTTEKEYGGMSEFVSWKYGDINVISANSVEFWKKFLVASSICKRLNLLQKKDRIAVFRAILYNEMDPCFNMEVI